MATWDITYEDQYEKFFWSLPEYEQAVLSAALETVLEVHGIDICSTSWGKPLGGGLYEFRVQKSLDAIYADAGLPLPTGLVGTDRKVLIRVFCTFHGNKVVLLLNGYDKKKDPSEKRQNREIARARKQLKKWQTRQKKN